jgi:dTDP-4-amino-4,6-dideoxygalactose transaminase
MTIEQPVGARRDERLGVPFVDLSGSARRLGPAFLRELEELMEAGAFVNGRYVDAFERDFATDCGRAYCVGVSSGLDALRLGLEALGIEPGDEVIVPAMTFIATFEAVVQAGGIPVAVDVRDADACLDIVATAAAVGSRTRFVMPVHLYGQMVDVSALAELAGQRGLKVVEDACQAHGASRDGLRAGACSEAAAFSFYPSKNLGAMGDAGALVTDDADVAATVRALRQHGETTRYHSDLVGYTARLDALQALVLSHKLPLLAGWNDDRREAAAYYTQALAGVGDLRLPFVPDGSTPVWHLYTVRTADPVALADFLGARGVQTGRHYPQPPHLSRAFASLGHPPGSFPIAEAIARETISLPIFPGIGEERLEAVVSAVQAFFARG